MLRIQPSASNLATPAPARTCASRSGAPLADDVLKCQLKSIAAKDYNGKLSADQLQQLQPR